MVRKRIADVSAEQAAPTGVGPREAEVPTIPGHPFVSPYEDLKLR